MKQRAHHTQPSRFHSKKKTNESVMNVSTKRSAFVCSKFNTLQEISQSKSNAVLHKRVRISRYASEQNDQNAVSQSRFVRCASASISRLKLNGYCVYVLGPGRSDIGVRICVNQLDNH